ncbi:pimeloyl-ACP methyl ester carboxylesterase [Paenibacillus forsythiae]|uniref:Pimeloyl-ACP methyl ester carboxylesterase n=1 Tax=Paenibacillus forsythiae TaxID=365616 RepID=A0ABU3H398_9BACL|nr:alpha/beta hydrolase [Paenibacillus forsythiae]MDT3425289.1 pimeloyl-ACP methyl ester carboxylesterase [Paenibacillus forsythiae]
MGSIFKSRATEEEYYHCYEKSLEWFGLEGTSRYIATTFGDTHVLCFGDPRKEPLILLHGMTMSSTMWFPNIKHLIQERCVYAVDIMGDFGKSKPTVVIKNRRAANQWILEVLDAMQFNKVDLAGHSMGGFLSLNFALAYPERVSKLLLYAPAGTFHRISLKFFMKIYPALLFHTEKWIDNAFLWFSGKGESLHPVFRSQVIAGYRHAKPRLQVMPSVFGEQEFHNFYIPTMLLIGDKEVIYPAEKAMANAKRLIPNLETHLIAGASHSLTMEHADVVNELTLFFLQKENDTIMG